MTQHPGNRWFVAGMLVSGLYAWRHTDHSTTIADYHKDQLNTEGNAEQS